MSILDQLALLTGALCVFLLIRNAIVFHITMVALEIAHERSERDFEVGVFNRWRSYYAALESPTYNQIMFDLTKWTVRGTYPALFADMEAP